MVIWLYLKAIGKHWWALMSCAVFTLLGFYISYANKNNDWAVKGVFVLAVLMLFVACFFAWRDEHEKLSAERTKNKGSRVEGNIRFALIDQKKRTPDGKVVTTKSECFVTILLYATNVNPADCWFNEWDADVNLTLTIDGAVCRGEYEALASAFSEFITTAPEVKVKGIFDFFARYQNAPMKDGLSILAGSVFDLMISPESCRPLRAHLQSLRSRSPIRARKRIRSRRVSSYRQKRLRHCSEPL